jgi:thiamine-monophosphate kinase
VRRRHDGTPGPTTVSITAFGRVARGKGLGRAGARAGDELWVSGTIGDAALGLLAVRGELSSVALARRYRLPQPRTTLGPLLVGIASATADISDGLLADAGHIADASGLCVRIERELVPLSPAARIVLRSRRTLWRNILGGGDDYELAIAVPPRKRAAWSRPRARGCDGHRVGAFTKGRGVVLTVSGHAQRAAQTGYVHF